MRETVTQLVISKAWVISQTSFLLCFSVAEKIKTQGMGSIPELQEQLQFFPQPAPSRPRILQSISVSGLGHLSFPPFSITCLPEWPNEPDIPHQPPSPDYCTVLLSINCNSSCILIPYFCLSLHSVCLMPRATGPWLGLLISAIKCKNLPVDAVGRQRCIKRTSFEKPLWRGVTATEC